LYAFLISPMRATYPAHLILLDLITLIMPGEDSCGLLLLPLSYVRTFSLSLCSEISSLFPRVTPTQHNG